MERAALEQEGRGPRLEARGRSHAPGVERGRDSARRAWSYLGLHALCAGDARPIGPEGHDAQRAGRQEGRGGQGDLVLLRRAHEAGVSPGAREFQVPEAGGWHVEGHVGGRGVHEERGGRRRAGARGGRGARHGRRRRHGGPLRRRALPREPHEAHGGDGGGERRRCRPESRSGHGHLHRLPLLGYGVCHHEPGRDRIDDRHDGWRAGYAGAGLHRPDARPGKLG